MNDEWGPPRVKRFLVEAGRAAAHPLCHRQGAAQSLLAGPDACCCPFQLASVAQAIAPAVARPASEEYLPSRETVPLKKRVKVTDRQW